MLDVRATRYVSPLSEVEFTDVVLTARLVNIADETGYITGAFRVYNDTTGLLIHTSDIEPISLAAGQTADVSALTDFSPPAPLDDTYFVLFDGQAVNALVPDGIGLHLGAWHFDVKPGPLGEPPEAHAPTHEQAGADPLDAGDLGTAELDTTLRLAPDGAGGVTWGSQQAPLTHHASHELGGSDELDATGLPGISTSELPQTLTDQAAIDWDLALGGAATVTLAGNRAMNAPTNMVNGAHYSLRVIQDVTGTRLITWDAVYRFPGGVDPCLTAAINTEDIILFSCNGTNMDCVGMVSAVS